MDFAGVSVRYAFGEQNAKFQVGDFYHVGEACENSELPYTKYGVNSSSAIRNFQSFNDTEIAREFGNSLNKTNIDDDKEDLEDAQGLLGSTSKSAEISSKLRSDVGSQETSKFVGDIIKMKNIPDDKMIEETNYIVKLEKMSPDTGTRNPAKISSHTEKKKSGKKKPNVQWDKN